MRGLENGGYPQYSMEELLPVVAELAERWMGNEHTSVTYERAQSFMEAVLYCLNEYSLCYEAQKLPACPNRRPSAGEAYRIGRQLVQRKTEALREMYNDLMVSFRDYGMECLYSTVIRGIPEFFKWYDVSYAPQETLLTLDYPILLDIRKLSGVDAVYAYVQCICLEQKFLGAFREETVRRALRSYHPDYGELIENICSIVLTDAVLHQLKKEEPEKNRKKNEGALRREARAAAEKLIVQFSRGDRSLEQYLAPEADNIAARLEAFSI